MMDSTGAQQNEPVTEQKRSLRDRFRPGVAGSFLLHVVVLFVLFAEFGAQPVALAVIPVNIVEIAEETTSLSQPEPNIAPRPQAGAQSQRVASLPPPRQPRVASVTPPAPPPKDVPPSTEQPAPDTLPPPEPDPLQTQLDALAKLRAPGGSGVANAPASGAGPPGPRGGYSVKDLIRAQVQRRWNLRLDELGERDFVIRIHVVLERDGTVSKAEIVDTARIGRDDAFRSIAISARNAVLLSSPLTLPVGITDEMRDMTLDFNPRDLLR